VDKEFTVTIVRGVDKTVEVTMTPVAALRKVDLRVMHAVTNLGIEDVLIAIYDADGNLVEDPLKTGAGGYADTELPDGTYDAHIYQNGFLVKAVEFEVDGVALVVPNIFVTPTP